MRVSAARDRPWRARLVNDIRWSLIVKFGLLALLWALFFSSSHRCRVDGRVTADRWALGAHTAGGDYCD